MWFSWLWKSSFPNFVICDCQLLSLSYCSAGRPIFSFQFLNFYMILARLFFSKLLSTYEWKFWKKSHLLFHGKSIKKNVTKDNWFIFETCNDNDRWVNGSLYYNLIGTLLKVTPMHDTSLILESSQSRGWWTGSPFKTFLKKYLYCLFLYISV